ncbi:Ba174 [Baboon cytomegalovirus]|nr:Ba174 [Baboon cytomegalovirus]
MNSKTAVTLLILPYHLLANKYNFKNPQNVQTVVSTTTEQMVLQLGRSFIFMCSFDCNCTRGIQFTSCNASTVETWIYHFVGGKDALEYNVQVNDTLRVLQGAANYTQNSYVSYAELGIKEYKVNHTGTYECFIFINKTMNITKAVQLSPMGDIYAFKLPNTIFYQVQCVFSVCFPGTVSLIANNATLLFQPTVWLCNGTSVVSQYMVLSKISNPDFQCNINATECPLRSYSQTWTTTKHTLPTLNMDECDNYSYPVRPTTTVRTLPTAISLTLNVFNGSTPNALRASRELHSLWMLVLITAVALGLWFLRIPQALMEKMRGYTKPLRIANNK